MQEFPGLLRAFAAAFEYFFQNIGERQGVEHVVEPHAACRNLIRWQRLKPYLPPREGDAGASDQQLQNRVDRRAASSRMVKTGNQKHDTHTDHADALENAQRAGLETLDVLQIERVEDQDRANEKSE